MSDSLVLWRLRPVVRDGRDVFDPTDLDARTRERADRRLRTGTGGLVEVAAGTAHANVHAL